MNEWIAKKPSELIDDEIPNVCSDSLSMGYDKQL